MVGNSARICAAARLNLTTALRMAGLDE